MDRSRREEEDERVEAIDSRREVESETKSTEALERSAQEYLIARRRAADSHWKDEDVGGSANTRERKGESL